MTTIYVLGVDPGMTGAAALVAHREDGHRRLVDVWGWEQNRKTGKQGQPIRACLPYDQSDAQWAMTSHEAEAICVAWMPVEEG